MGRHRRYRRHIEARFRLAHDGDVLDARRLPGLGTGHLGSLMPWVSWSIILSVCGSAASRVCGLIAARVAVQLAVPLVRAACACSGRNASGASGRDGLPGRNADRRHSGRRREAARGSAAGKSRRRAVRRQGRRAGRSEGSIVDCPRFTHVRSSLGARPAIPAALSAAGVVLLAARRAFAPH